MTRHDLLFTRGDLRLSLEAQGDGLVREVEQAPEEHLLKVDEDAWVRALVERHSVTTPVLQGDKAWMDPVREVPTDVSSDHFSRFIVDPSRPAYIAGYRTVIHIPFTGEKDVFLLRPSNYTMNPPSAEVHNAELRLAVEYPHDRPANIKAITDGLVESVGKHLAWASGDIEQFNRSLAERARQAVRTRRERVRRHYEHIAATGLPMGPRGQSSKTFIADAVTRRPAPLLPNTPVERPMALEPVLGDAVFEHILSVVRQVALDIERSPKTYAGMGEEDRRQVLLVALNTHYRGQGTAEAFNVGGKTDILIRHEGSNLFIAECKFWSGQKAFVETIDQLFGYRAWRDTKLAVVMFVREKDLTGILEKGTTALGEHAQFVEWGEAGSEAELRATVSWPGDARRHADVAVFFISTPSKQRRAGAGGGGRFPDGPTQS